MVMSWRSRLIGSGVAGAALLGGLALPAYAEGSWSSYISGWLISEQSRSWDDSNSDGVSTAVTLSGCSIPNGQTFQSVKLGLYREITLLPDESQGTITKACGTYTWGDESSGSYHFTLLAINGDSSGAFGYNFSASSVYVVY